MPPSIGLSLQLLLSTSLAHLHSAFTVQVSAEKTHHISQACVHASEQVAKQRSSTTSLFAKTNCHNLLPHCLQQVCGPFLCSYTAVVPALPEHV